MRTGRRCKLYRPALHPRGRSRCALRVAHYARCTECAVPHLSRERAKYTATSPAVSYTHLTLPTILLV
eukprot:8704896-Pyramimonas_sp.AAC.1